MIYQKLKVYAPERLACAYGGVLLALAAAVLSVGSYYLLYGFLKKILVTGDLAGALTLAWQIVGCLVASTVVYFAAVWCTHILGFRLETNLKKQGIRHLMQASFGFYDQHPSGRIRKILDDNTALTHMSVAHLIPDLSTAVFVPVLGSVLVFTVDVRLGGIFVATMVAGLIAIQRLMGDRHFMTLYMRALETMNAGAVEYVRGIQVLKIFKADIQSLGAFYRAIRDYADIALRYSMSCRRGYVFFQVVFNAVFLAALFLFFAGAEPDRVFLAKFMFYVLFNGVLFVAFMKIMYVGMYIFQANSAIGKIETLFDQMTAKKLTPGQTEAITDTAIAFEDVSFGYGETPILSHLSFELAPGKTYALVGASGSGKSTLAKLISGFYRLDGGHITIGGRPLEAYTEAALARNIANVFQDARLFKRSIYDNVLVGQPNADREAVMRALSLAQCDEILAKFPEREHTLIGAKGVHLSGGEVQRIAIARAILKDAPIVILDEASAAADPENEYELQRALANLMADKTVIMIAHRLSAIQNVDEILVIDAGQVVERGSHADLMARDSRYKKLQDAFARANAWRVKP